MALKQSLGEEACQVSPFANVNANIQGFIQQQRNSLEVSTLSGSLCHGSSLLPRRQTPIRTETRRGWRGPRTWKCRSHRLRCSPQTYQGFRAPPPLKVKGSGLGRATPRGPLQFNITRTFVQNQDFSSLCQNRSFLATNRCVRENRNLLVVSG